MFVVGDPMRHRNTNNGSVIVSSSVVGVPVSGHQQQTDTFPVVVINQENGIKVLELVWIN